MRLPARLAFQTLLFVLATLGATAALVAAGLNEPAASSDAVNCASPSLCHLASPRVMHAPRKDAPTWPL